ncbi:histidine--tRNA ligase [Paenibacillus ihbetae]|uniref:Histidine--tRNA ligase n=1 Tax=Paenibacillus ihbetae TaxID=1870820 RepID=A0ABX3JYU0_9BACL|nr:histidine--tRNA ligase [Paenibacillus ihbetae]OOC61684.1 histidine--tRNA ligase [Paenibacillus ihbetae]
MQNVKGTYDYFGLEQAIRKNVQATLEEVFELYDFDGMDTSVLNELDLLTSKYAGGDEILKEMYQLTDQGKRSLGLRYDLTIPFAKVIALNPGIELPFKRYEIGKVFRDGPVKRGRLREFIQCDVDVVGVVGPEAEAELMQLATEAFKRLEIPIVLRWNNRRFLGEVLESIGISPKKKLTVMLTLDKINKIGREDIIKELESKGLNTSSISEILELIAIENPTFEQISSKCGIQKYPGALEVVALQELIVKLGLERICKFDPFLSRGLSFYTGTVYEIFDATNSYKSSLGGGGRYDSIIGQLVGKKDVRYPTVGLSFGMESIIEMMSNRNTPIKPPSVVVIPIGDTIAEALRVSAELRNSGVRVRIDNSKRKLKKSLASVSSKAIPYVIFIGENEASAGNLRLKDMNEMTETVVNVTEAIDFLKI